MSYYETQNNKQRSFGISIVIALHVVLIYGLFALNTAVNEKKEDKTIKAEIVDKVPPKIEEIIPPKPSEDKRTIPDFISPSNLDFEPDVADNSNAIKHVQNEVAPLEANPTFVKAKRSSKGLTHPKYPKEAARLGQQGTTELNLNIAENGSVTEALIASSSGSDILDQTIATHALHHWKFTPCMNEGKPISCWYKFIFQWDIENANKSGTWRSVVDAKAE
jgi:periplasmic protein TonB